jgi:hypothetical protein
MEEVFNPSEFPKKSNRFVGCPVAIRKAASPAEE